MQKKNFLNKRAKEDYFVGLDIGTNSVGWCVTDLNYNVLKFHGKAMWGVRLFEEAETAEGRRMQRTSRRRLNRRKQRISLLQELLSEGISKVDPTFYLRLQESRFLREDKKEPVRQRYTLFADKMFTDKEYHQKFPTIYHLRDALMKGEEKYDIRLYYLAIANCMKHRGHFLFVGDVSEAKSFDVVWDNLNDYLQMQYDFTITCMDMPKVQELLSEKRISKTDKKRIMNTLFKSDQDTKENASIKKEMLNALCGSSVALDKLFDDAELKDAEISKFSFSDGIDDDKEEKLNTVLGDRFELVVRLKAVYDWGVLTNILKGSKTFSEAQIAVYEKHKKDLDRLKYIVHTYCPDEYAAIFKDCGIKENYPSYVRHSSYKRKPVAEKRITEQKDFCDFLKKRLEKVEADDPVLKEVRQEIDNYTFMPKQISKSNSVIPYQVHREELKKILDNLKRDYPEFGETQEDGSSVCDKILKLFGFRIPYFVGPLNTYHSDKGGNSWMVRKKEGAIRPWNFFEMVDEEKSAEAFIRRLTNKCTYLMGEDVLPKDSLLYSKYRVLNELNTIRINGERLDVSLKQEIYQRLFLNREISGKITVNKFQAWLERENLLGEIKIEVITGIDGEFRAALDSYHQLKAIIGTKVNTELRMTEDIIRNVLIFGEDKRLLKQRLKNQYGDKLTDEELKKITKLKFSSWGNFSEKLLSGIESVNKETGEVLTIIRMMWETQKNFMELMSSEYDYRNEIQKHNEQIMENHRGISYDLVEESYASPAVKRSVWQALLIVEEIRKIMGHAPKRIFVETTRENDAKKKGKRTTSRKEQLLLLYKNIKDEERDWITEINNNEERKFNSKKLFLYYTQMGKSAYTGHDIPLSVLFSNEYDIDHIHPQSKKTDDSLLNNMVLVESWANRDKEDNYPIPNKYRQEELWKIWKQKGLIETEKYNRLMRTTPLTDEELAGFISRQIVETSQANKVISDILKQVFPEPDTKIVYSKARLVSDFRNGENGSGKKDQDGEDTRIKFLKSRSVNDYHHAKDAYLNIVVGNAYYMKFTDNPMNFIRKNVKEKHEQYNVSRLFYSDVERGGMIAWKKGKDGTLATVIKYMGKNNIQFTRYAMEKRGGMFDQMPLRKGSGVLYPLKSSDERMDTEKYGGYNKPSINYFMLVESDRKKGQRKRTLEGVPVYLSNVDEEQLLSFCREKLKIKNPDICLREIKINSLLKIDGYPMHISGKTGNRIVVKSAVQLCLDQRYINYIKAIEKIVDKLSENKNYRVDEERDGITREGNMEIYLILVEKSQNPIFMKRSANQAETFEGGKEKFKELEIEGQCKVILEMLKYFKCNAESSDLNAIGGSSNAGVFLISKEITKYSKVSVVNQSPTGLFDQEMDLLKI